MICWLLKPYNQSEPVMIKNREEFKNWKVSQQTYKQEIPSGPNTKQKHNN